MPGGSHLPVVGVMGSGKEPCPESWLDRADALGTCIAHLGCHLLTGGGGGLMAAAARGFVAVTPRDGLSVGVLPARSAGDASAPDGYPNPWIELSVRTHLEQRGPQGAGPRSRNHINVLSADAVVVLPGGPGTASEAALAVRYGQPVIAWLMHPAELAARPTKLQTASTIDGVKRWLEETVKSRR